MPTKCSICSSPHLAAISDLADGEVPLKEISAQFSLSYSSLVRHCARHRNPAPKARGAGDDLQQKSDLLWQRSNEVWSMAEQNEDVRGLVQSLQAGLRSLELSHKQAERKAEAASEGKDLFDEDGRLDVRALTEVSDWYDRCLSETQKRTITKAAELERELGVSDGFALFESMRVSPELRVAVLEFAHNYQLAKKGTVEPVQTESTAD